MADNNTMGMTRDLFKKIRDTKRIFHAKMGTMKDRNSMDLTEAESIKKRWQENTELLKKDLHDPDDHYSVSIHLEPDIMECEVKKALEKASLMDKGSGGDGIPVELFQILKDDAVKVLHSICKKFGNSSGQWTGKGQFSFQSQRKAMPKNVQSTAQLHSFHTLVR